MTASSRLPALWIWIFAGIAFIGLIDSVYLTTTHYSGETPLCTAMEGCDEVALSDYATIGPFPVALYGAVFYAVMIIVSFVWLDIRKAMVIRVLPFLTVPAFLFSGWLVYLMYAVIQAWCLFCLISAGTTTLLMILSLYMYSRMNTSVSPAL